VHQDVSVGYTTSRALFATGDAAAVRDALVRHLGALGLHVESDPGISYNQQRFEIISKNGWTVVDEGLTTKFTRPLAREISRDLGVGAFAMLVTDSDRSILQAFRTGKSLGTRWIFRPLPTRLVPRRWAGLVRPRPRLPWTFQRGEEYGFERVTDALGIGDLPYLFASEVEQELGTALLEVVAIDPVLPTVDVDQGTPDVSIRTFPLSVSLDHQFEHPGFHCENEGGAASSLEIEFPAVHPMDFVKITEVVVGGISGRDRKVRVPVIDQMAKVPIRLFPRIEPSERSGITMGDALQLQVTSMQNTMLRVSFVGQAIRLGSGPVAARIRFVGSSTFERQLWLPVTVTEPEGT
jgi:hypothetical protein